MHQTPELLNAPAHTSFIDLIHRPHEETSSLPGRIKLRGNEIAADLYPTLLALTANDTFEKGVTVSRGVFGKITTSEIISGTKTHVDFPPPPLLGRVLSYVHTHPRLAEIKKELPTSMPSNDDYLAFAESGSAAFVILDEGGIHALLKKRGIQRKEFLPKDLFERSVSMALQRDGLVLTAMKNLATFLSSYGIGYYFTPSHTITPDGYLSLRDVRAYQKLETKQLPQSQPEV